MKKKPQKRFCMIHEKERNRMMTFYITITVDPFHSEVQKQTEEVSCGVGLRESCVSRMNITRRTPLTLLVYQNQGYYVKKKIFLKSHVFNHHLHQDYCLGI